MITAAMRKNTPRAFERGCRNATDRTSVPNRGRVHRKIADENGSQQGSIRLKAVPTARKMIHNKRIDESNFRIYGAFLAERHVSQNHAQRIAVGGAAGRR
jgi:hypothetical protein